VLLNKEADRSLTHSTLEFHFKNNSCLRTSLYSWNRCSNDRIIWIIYLGNNLYPAKKVWTCAVDITFMSYCRRDKI